MSRTRDVQNLTGPFYSTSESRIGLEATRDYVLIGLNNWRALYFDYAPWVFMTCGRRSVSMTDVSFERFSSRYKGLALGAVLFASNVEKQEDCTRVQIVEE